MIGAVGGWVKLLHRERMGDLVLDPALPLGGVRALNTEELKIILEMLPEDRRCPREWREGTEGNIAMKKRKRLASPPPSRPRPPPSANPLTASTSPSPTTEIPAGDPNASTSTFNEEIDPKESVNSQ